MRKGMRLKMRKESEVRRGGGMIKERGKERKGGIPLMYC